MRWLLLLLLACPAPRPAPEPPAPTPPPAETEDRQLGHVEGRVVDPQDKPIAGATISTDNGIRARSGADGIYHLMLAPGEYDVSASADGYKPSRFTIGVDGGAVVIRNWLLQPE